MSQGSGPVITRREEIIVTPLVIALLKPRPTYGSGSDSVLRRNLCRFRMNRMWFGGSLSLMWLTGLHSSALAAESAPGKEYPACTAKADEENVQAARGAFEAGKAAFNEGDYPRAIVYWEDAFRRDCSATLMLKNLTRAYEAAGQFEAAAGALRTYLSRAPQAEDKAELEEQLRSLEGKTSRPVVATPPPAGRPAKPQTPSPATSQPSATSRPEHQPQEDDVEVGAADESDSEGESRPVNLHYVGASVVAGVGVAVAVTSTILWSKADAEEGSATAQCPTRQDCPPEVSAAGNEAIDRKLMWSVVGGGGLAMVVGGVAWYLLAPSENAEQALLPTLGPTYAGLAWQGEF